VPNRSRLDCSIRQFPVVLVHGAAADWGIAGVEQVSEKGGGLNGSTQHLLKVFLQDSTGLISFARHQFKQNTALFRFWWRTAVQIVSRWEVLSDQLVRWSRIDRLSWQVISEADARPNFAAPFPASGHLWHTELLRRVSRIPLGSERLNARPANCFGQENFTGARAAFVARPT
jgi:hypothetical protein